MCVFACVSHFVGPKLCLHGYTVGNFFLGQSLHHVNPLGLKLVRG